jgi:mannosylglycerate hydrolase
VNDPAVQPIERSSKDRQVLIVPHTHWDREWYWSLSGYRHRLIDMLDDVIDRISRPDDPDGLPVFWLDSQVAPLLDYLESKPEQAETIRRLVQQNKLRIGPWFIQGDEHLVDGESCVRNLLLGRFHGRAFGPLKQIGYVPDQFGHTAQLPQILRKAGIDNAVFWRAIVNQTQNRLTWRGPDGSEVLVLWLQDSYANAMEMPEDLDGAVAKLKEAIGKDRPYNADGIRLLMSGVDHALAAPMARQAAAALEKEWSIPVRIVGLDDVIEQARTAAPKNLPQVNGELLYSPHLYGCWTSRIYLKQANDRCCRLLETWAEPLAAMALWHAGIDLRGELRTAWRQLVLNHPHDSICGCSTDEVHREMMVRFETAETIGRNVATRAAMALQLAGTFPGGKIDVLNRSVNWIQDRLPTHLTLWNPAGRAVAETIVAEVVWPGENVAGLKITDAAGRALPVQVIEQEPYRFRRWRPNGNPTRHAGRRFVLALQPTEPLCACGMTALHLEPLAGQALVDHTHEMEKTSTRSAAQATGVTCHLNVLENDLLRVEVHADGSCDLLHKATGRSYRRLCTLADFGESGDSYSHITPIRDEQVLAEAGTVSVTTAGGLFACIEVRTRMLLPAGRSADKCGRSGRRISCPVVIRYSLGAGWPYAKVEVDFVNRVRHHLLRAVFPTGKPVDAHVASVPLASLKRTALPVEWQQTDRGETPLWPDGWPQLGWIDLPGEDANLAIIAPGTPHYDVQPDGTCRVNLLRTFSNLIWSWEPMCPMPEGQCLGKQRFQFALYPHIGDHVAAQVEAVSQTAALGPYPIVGQALPGSLLQNSVITTSPSALRLTALKPADEGDGLVLRVLNDSDQPTEAIVRVNLPVSRIVETDLLEQPVAGGRPCRVDGQTTRFPMQPYEFVTFRLDRR